MRIINLGGATAIIEHNGKRMLFDPWLDDGIFHGAWYHWPPIRVGMTDLGRFDYVYISHIHEDHCSAGTIRHLNRDAEIILMDRQPNFVAKFLDSYGFKFKKVHLVTPRKELELEPGLSVNMLEADPAHELAYVIDSAMVLRWDGFVIYNANDCQPYEGVLQYLKSYYGRIDLALLPYAGGSGYPSCYLNLTAEEKLHEKQRIMELRLAAFVRTAQALDPRYIMPFADQYVVAGSRAYLNKYVSHPASPGVVEAALEQVNLTDRLILLNSCQAFDFDRGRKVPDDGYVSVSEADCEAYLSAALRDKLYDHEKVQFSPSVSSERLVHYARSRLWAIQQRKKLFPEFSFYLDFQDTRNRFLIRLNAELVEEVGWEEPLQTPYLRVSGSNSLMIMLLIGHISWNIADAALFLDYERVPNVYDPNLYVFLNYLRV